jgi:pyruvate dehydrogenase kinase 2/3/4
MCTRRYGRTGRQRLSGKVPILTFPPTFRELFTHYVVLELLKDALRCDCETHTDIICFRCDGVVIADGTDNEDVIIKISDQGEVLRGVIDKICVVLVYTADPRFKEAFIGERITVTSLRLRGLVTGYQHKLLPVLWR